MSTIGSRIKELRLRRGLTQDQIAERLDMTRANFSHYERDNAEPPSATLSKLADILGTTTDYLLGREGFDVIDDEINRLALDIYELPAPDQELIKAMLKTMLERNKPNKQ
jgi:transcriptional regulator with XRE-family HTH domain